MLKIYLIRHGKTQGNLSGKYIGARTDEPLCQEGIRELEGKNYPKAELLFVSPMKRCRQTGEILYPGLAQKECSLLKECDFGDFENKNYKELSGNPDYQAWIDSGGALPFPGGEDPEGFRNRCREGFVRCVEEAFAMESPATAIVAHGGTIMSILSAYGYPKQGYFDWQIKNGEYYVLILEEELWKNERHVLSVKKGLWTDV